MITKNLKKQSFDLQRILRRNARDFLFRRGFTNTINATRVYLQRLPKPISLSIDVEQNQKRR